MTKSNPREKPTEEERIHAWRVEMFQSLGFEKAEAKLLERSDVDCHEMEALLKAGCSRELAELILI